MFPQIVSKCNIFLYQFLDNVCVTVQHIYLMSNQHNNLNGQFGTREMC